MSQILPPTNADGFWAVFTPKLSYEQEAVMIVAGVADRFRLKGISFTRRH
jgi:hypothetical protein